MFANMVDRLQLFLRDLGVGGLYAPLLQLLVSRDIDHPVGANYELWSATILSL